MMNSLFTIIGMILATLWAIIAGASYIFLTCITIFAFLFFAAIMTPIVVVWEYFENKKVS